MKDALHYKMITVDSAVTTRDFRDIDLEEQKEIYCKYNEELEDE